MVDRLWLLAVVFALVAVVFSTRLFQLQIVDGAGYALEVERSTLLRESVPARRGRILDRNGAPIADTKAVYHLAVVFAELELAGRARSGTPLWRLDERHFDALVADLTARLRWIGRGQGPREVLLDTLLNHPAVAVRSGARDRVRQADLSLVACARTALSPLRQAGSASAAKSQDPDPLADTARLAESDLLSDDPCLALERELAAQWGEAALVLSSAQFARVAAMIDADYASAIGAGGRCQSVLDPFASVYRLRVPVAPPEQNQPASDLEVRIMPLPRRHQAEGALARVLGEDQAVLHERIERAIRLARGRPPATRLFYGAASDAERIAPSLPVGQALFPISLPEVPGARERVLIIQGDSGDGAGVFSRLGARIGASLGIDGVLIEALIVKHAERIRALTSDRDYRVHHLVLDPQRLDRLAQRLAAALTALARSVNVLEVERQLAAARRLIDRGWQGQRAADPLPVVRDVPHAVAVRLFGADSQPPDEVRRRFDDADAILPGLVVRLDVGRSYPFPESSAHLIGLVGRDRDADAGDALRGTSGLERQYDAQLKGSGGTRLKIRTPDGVRVLRDETALAGADLVTEIDMELQTLAEDSLARYIDLAKELRVPTARMEAAAPAGRGRAGFCLIDCRTGGVLALASTPGIRLDQVGERITEVGRLEAAAKAEPDPSRAADLRMQAKLLAIPLHDHASEGEQPPGSSFKILTALCGLELGVLTPGEIIHCQGYMAMVNGKKVLRDHAPAGNYDLQEAIQHSSNVYFAIIADRIAKKVGREALSGYADRIGLGRDNAIDIEQQKPRFAGDRRFGLVPSPASIAKLRPTEPAWLPSDSWRMGIGQFAYASPLQCACIAAAVANGGHVVRPFLVRPQSGPVIADLNIRVEYLNEVRRGMEKVTQAGGTASSLFLEGENSGIRIAAKTGTAEWGSAESRAAGRTPDHAWLIGYAPADRPVVAFACFIHSGTFGGSACTPVVKRILERYFRKYGREGHREPVVPGQPDPH